MRCDGEILWTLVEQSTDPGGEADEIAEHLESCESCREQLTAFGGEVAWWNDAEHLLSLPDSKSDDHPFPAPPSLDLSFLSEPTHPEMLGRIGRYDVEAVVGRGGMGVVLRGYDSDLRRTVAIKVMAPEWAASIAARRRFSREAQSAASVAHENVVPIYNVESEAALPYLVMRYVPGSTLQRWVDTHGPPDVATILRVSGQLAEGLAAAHHRGLVHRDIKPGNVLVGENIDRVWITDFGLARAADSATLTRTGVIAGTPHYMSPEQARGESIDHRSDLFSLGSLLFFLSAGRSPFDGENTLGILHQIVTKKTDSLATIRKDLPPSFVGLVDQLLQQSPAKRPTDCDAVIKRVATAWEELHSGRVARAPLSRRTKCMAAVCAMALATLLSIDGYLLFGPDVTTDVSRMRLRDTFPDSADGLYGNPLSSPSRPVAVSPYVAKATEQIDETVAVDAKRFRNQVNLIDQHLQHLARPLDEFTLPRATLGNEAWSREINKLESAILRIRQR